MPTLIVFLVALAWLPGVRAGFMADDHFLFFSLGQLPAAAPLHNLFALVGSADEVRVYRECGLLPWWTSDDMRLVFWRPVSSLTHWLDWRLFGNDPVAMHLVSLGWYLLAIALVWRVFSRIFAEGSLALALAVTVFALDDAHVINVQWIASRNDLVCATFLLLSLLGVMRLREGRSRANLAWVYGGLSVALLSKESAVVLPVLVLAHVFFISGAEGGTGLSRLRTHAGLLLSLFGLVGVYLLNYFLAGLGPNSLFYLNPFRVPELWAGSFLRAAAAHASILVSGVPLHTITPSPWHELPLLAAGCAVLTVCFCGLVWRFLRDDPPTRFALAWVVTGLALVTTTFPDPRLLFVASMGFAMIVGRLAQVLWARRATWPPARWLVGGLVATHLVLAPAVTQVSLAVVRSLPGNAAEVVHAVDQENLPLAVTEVFFLNWNQPATSPIAGLWLLDQLPPVTVR